MQTRWRSYRGWKWGDGVSERWGRAGCSFLQGIWNTCTSSSVLSCKWFEGWHFACATDWQVYASIRRYLTYRPLYCEAWFYDVSWLNLFAIDETVTDNIRPDISWIGNTWSIPSGVADYSVAAVGSCTFSPWQHKVIRLAYESSEARRIYQKFHDL